MPIVESLLETYYRSIRVGDSEAHLGVSVVTAILRPFTAGEDAVVAWIRVQDDAVLEAVVPLTDGRDYVVLRRLYTHQPYAEAVRECEKFSRAMAWFPKQHGPATRQSAVSIEPSDRPS